MDRPTITLSGALPVALAATAVQHDDKPTGQLIDERLDFRRIQPREQACDPARRARAQCRPGENRALVTAREHVRTRWRKAQAFGQSPSARP